MAGKRTPTTLDGHAINDGTIYVSKFTIDSAIGEVFESDAITAQVAREFPAYVGSQPNGRVLTMRVRLGRIGTANHYSDLQTLKQWCSARQGEVVLKATDEAASPNTLRLTVKPIGLRPVEGTDWMYDARFWVSKPVWENDTEDDSTNTIDTAGSERWTVTNDGSDAVKPRITLTPNNYKAAANGPVKQRHVVIANRSPLALQDAYGNPYPIEITGGGWDEETKVKAGNLHPQGYDVHVFVDDVEVNRYLTNWGAGFGKGDSTDTGNFKTWESVDNDSFHAQRFRLAGCSENEQITVDDVRLFLKKFGSPTGNMVLEIRTDSGGLPSNTVVTNGTTNNLDVSTLTTSLVEKTFTFAANPVLNAETWYWLVIKPPTGGTHNASNYVIMAETTIDPSTANYEGEIFSSAHADSTTGTWYRGMDMFGFGDHGLDGLSVIDFRMYTTGNAKIWVPMLMPGGIQLTLGAGLQSATAALGQDKLTIADFEGHARLPDRCAVLIGTEVIILNGKDGTSQMHIAKRGARGTTAAAHNAGDAIYLVPFDVRIVFDHENFDGLAKPAYEPRAQAPVIDGITSTNEQFKWVGPFLAVGEETRPMAWRPESDDSVDLDEYVTLDMDTTNDDTDITFKDALASGAFLQRNVVTQHFPTGIEASASAITIDEASIPASLTVEHLLTNERGEEELIASHRSTDSGSAKTLTPTDEAYRYRIRLANGAIVGCETGDAANFDISGASTTDYYGESFMVDEEALCTSVAVRLKRGASRTFTATIRILKLEKINDTDYQIDIVAESASFTNADTSTSYSTITKSFSTPVVLAKDSLYWVGVYISAIGGSGALDLSAGTAKFARGLLLKQTNVLAANLVADTDQPTDIWFRAFGTPGQADAIIGTGSTCNLDNIIVNLDDVTPRTPRVIFEGSDQSCFLMDATLENTTPVRSTGARVIEAVDGSETGLDIDNPEPFRILPKVIQIDSEQMNVTALTIGAPNVITVSRGYNGTAAATHTSGTEIKEAFQKVTIKAILQTAEELDIDWEKRTATISDDDRAERSALAVLSGFDEGDPFRLDPGGNVLKFTAVGLDGSHTVSARSRFREAFL